MSRSVSAQREPKPSPARPRATPDIDLARLESLPSVELRQLWLAHGGRAKSGGGKSDRGRSVQRRIMVREIAYRVQSRRAGGMDKATARLLKQAVRAVLDGREMSSPLKVGDQSARTPGTRAKPPASLTQDQSHPPLASYASSDALASRPTRPSEPTRRTRSVATPAAPPAPLPDGARIIRVWRGRTYEVTVVEDGKAFNYKGKTYRSLSKIAREITGTVWSGPLFFGLTKQARPRAKEGRS